MILKWQPSTADSVFSWSQEGETLATLQWSKNLQPFDLVWKGPDNLNIQALTDQRIGQRSIAVIIGPTGSQGAQGPRGLTGSNIPDTLDGGNF